MRLHFFALSLALLLAAPALTRAGDEPPKPGKVHELTSKAHGRKYSLIVPSSYAKKKSWPLVISSHGAGGSGAGEMRAWQALANQHGFIVACPDMVTATNDRPTTSNLPGWKEDDEVILSIHEEISSWFRVNPRAVMITGFSGGGNPSYHTGLGHPEVFTHICTRGGNFSPQQVPRDKDILEQGRSALSIYIFYGEKDHPLIVGENGQPGAAVNAHTALKNAGYENLVIEEVAGMKHESRPAKAAAWFAEYVKANEKRFKEGDKADNLIARAKDARGRDRTAEAAKHLLLAQKILAKSKLPPAADAAIQELEHAAQDILGEARMMHESGDAEAAIKLAEPLVRAYKGLPVSEQAKQLLKEWKKK
jgi:poly(3-hydroxybutyrate) depolymerase